MLSHKQIECPKQQVKCPFSKYGCTSVHRREDMKAHVEHFKELHGSLKTGWLVSKLEHAMAEKTKLMIKLKNKSKTNKKHKKDRRKRRAQKKHKCGSLAGIEVQ